MTGRIQRERHHMQGGRPLAERGQRFLAFFPQWKGENGELLGGAWSGGKRKKEKTAKLSNLKKGGEGVIIAREQRGGQAREGNGRRRERGQDGVWGELREDAALTPRGPVLHELELSFRKRS